MESASDEPPTAASTEQLTNIVITNMSAERMEPMMPQILPILALVFGPFCFT